MTNHTSRYTCSGRTAKVKRSDRSRVEHFFSFRAPGRIHIVTLERTAIYTSQRRKSRHGADELARTVAQYALGKHT